MPFCNVGCMQIQIRLSCGFLVETIVSCIPMLPRPCFGVKDMIFLCWITKWMAAVASVDLSKIPILSLIILLEISICTFLILFKAGNTSARTTKSMTLKWDMLIQPVDLSCWIISWKRETTPLTDSSSIARFWLGDLWEETWWKLSWIIPGFSKSWAPWRRIAK